MLRKIFAFISIISIMLLSINDVNAQTKYAPNGGCFTPKGDLRVLFIGVRFGEAVDTTIKIDWAWDAYKPFPESILNKQVFYTDFADFNTLSTDYSNPANYERDKENISRWYYEISKLF